MKSHVAEPIHGRLVDGRLTDVSPRPAAGPEDVLLVEMPDFVGPMGYDPDTRRAVPLALERCTPAERLASVGHPLAAALSLRLSGQWQSLPSATREWAQKTIDDLAQAAAQALA